MDESDYRALIYKRCRQTVGNSYQELHVRIHTRRSESPAADLNSFGWRRQVVIYQMSATSILVKGIILSHSCPVVTM